MDDPEERPLLSNLIAALQIFASYGDFENPVYCDRDTLSVLLSPTSVAPVDRGRLDKLGFFPDHDNDCFVSYRYCDC